jgi:pimeloyl-ACP methyl ester carboxylesterase
MTHKEIEIEVGGVKSRMFRGGEGVPVLFLHGAAGLSAWTPFFAEMAKEYDFIVTEHPGFGKSDNPAYLKTMGDLAEYYLNLIEVLELPHFHLVGNSIGGWLASEIATRDSSRLKSFTVIAPAGLRPKVIDDAPRTPESETRKLFFNQAIADRMLAQVPTDEQKRIQQKNQATTAKLGNFSFCNPGLEAALGTVQIPSLVVWGDSDRVVAPSNAALWRAALPDARVVIIPQAGHLPHAEKPAAVAEKLRAFLAAASQ